MSHGEFTPEAKVRVAALLAQGLRIHEIAEQTGVHRSTIWEWRKDPEFAAMVDEVVKLGLAEAAQQLGALAPLAVDAFERGLRSSVRTQALVVDGEVQVIELRDDSLAVRTADLVTRRLPELMPRSGVDVSLESSEQLADLIRRLDARRSDDGQADRGASAPAA